MSLKTFFKKIIDKSGYKVFKPNPYSIFDFESFLFRHLANKDTLTFVQIGANDGSLLDPLFKFNMNNKSKVKGWVIEPLPDLFAQLSKNYKPVPSIVPVNIAIHNTQKQMTMYRANPSQLSDSHKFAGAIASFDPDFYKKTKLGLTPEDIVEETVNCMSFTDFLSTNNITALDLLQIDTEGYDAAILNSINFNIIKPKIIRFEHGVRDELMTTEEFKKICDMLNSHGYQIIAESYDATAYLLNPVDLIF